MGNNIKIILKNLRFILRKSWIGYMIWILWLKIGTSGGLLWTRWWTVQSTK